MISTVAPSASKAMSVASPATPATAGTNWRVPHSSWRRRWASASLTGMGWRSMFSSPSWKKISAGTWSRLRSQIPPLSTSTLYGVLTPHWRAESCGALLWPAAAVLAAARPNSRHPVRGRRMVAFIQGGNRSVAPRASPGAGRKSP